MLSSLLIDQLSPDGVCLYIAATCANQEDGSVELMDGSCIRASVEVTQLDLSLDQYEHQNIQ
jgi:hypothetical protein